MSNKSVYLANLVLSTYLTDNTPYLALFNGDPLDSGTELAGGDYARQLIPFGDPTSGKVQNTESVVFPAPAANWDEATHWAIYDAVTSGNRLYQGILSAPKTVKLNDPPFEVGIGGITITEE